LLDPPLKETGLRKPFVQTHLVPPLKSSLLFNSSLKYALKIKNHLKRNDIQLIYKKNKKNHEQKIN